MEILDVSPHARTLRRLLPLSDFSFLTYSLACEKETRELWDMVRGNFHGICYFMSSQKSFLRALQGWVRVGAKTAPKHAMFSRSSLRRAHTHSAILILTDCVSVMEVLI